MSNEVKLDSSEAATAIPVDSLWQRVMEAIGRGIAGFFRQSSPAQYRRNKGSQAAQEDSIRDLEVFGVSPDQVRVVLAYGESGRRAVVRRKFEQLLGIVERGEVGLVLLARHDRLGRNDDDSKRLFHLMADRGMLLMVGGRIYDPADEGDAFILNVYAQVAEYENRARMRWMMMSRFAMAQRLAARIRLPSGLVWASPEDPDYVARLEDADLMQWLHRRSEHRAVSYVENWTSPRVMDTGFMLPSE